VDKITFKKGKYCKLISEETSVTQHSLIVLEFCCKGRRVDKRIMHFGQETVMEAYW